MERWLSGKECLLCNHEDLSSNPPSPCKELSCWGTQRQEGLWDLLSSSLASVQWETLPQGQKMERDRAGHTMSFRPLHTHGHISVYTHIYNVHTCMHVRMCTHTHRSWITCHNFSCLFISFSPVKLFLHFSLAWALLKFWLSLIIFLV